MKKKVFVSGPIHSMETRQDYRSRLEELLLRYGYEPVDPWKREKVMYRGSPEEWWENVAPKGFIQRDLEDIEECEALIAYLPMLSAGTCMELFYAKLKRKKTVTVCIMKDPSPWIIAHSDIIVGSIRELEEHLKEGI